MAAFNLASKMTAKLSFQVFLELTHVNIDRQILANLRIIYKECNKCDVGLLVVIPVGYTRYATDMNKPGSRIAVISVIKFWSSSPPSWYSRSSVLCGRKNKLLTGVLTFRKFP